MALKSRSEHGTRASHRMVEKNHSRDRNPCVLSLGLGPEKVCSEIEAV